MGRVDEWRHLPGCDDVDLANPRSVLFDRTEAIAQFSVVAVSHPRLRRPTSRGGFPEGAFVALKPRRIGSIDPEHNRIDVHCHLVTPRSSRCSFAPIVNGPP